MAHVLFVAITWDETKNLANQKEQGISFEEASVLFTSGVDAQVRFDGAHSDDEDRWVTVGPIARGVISVVYTERGADGEETRIISARAATKEEINEYRQYLEGEWK